MVIKFAIEPDALVDVSYDSVRAVRRHHKQFIKLWEQFGLLVDPGEGPDSITSLFDSAAFRKVRTMWQEAWKTKRLCRRTRPQKGLHVRWQTLNSPSDLAGYEQLIDLALVENTRGIVCLGIPDDDQVDENGDVYSTYCGKVEAGFFRYPEETQSFSSMLDLSQRTVMTAGQGRGAIWSAWFENVARRSKEVTVLDRYGFSRRGVNGICWTLRYLTECMMGGVVTIFASNPSSPEISGVPEQELVNRVSTVLTRKPGSLQSVTIFLVADQEMTRDRYIRFDDCAFSVGHGVSEALREECLEQDMPCMLDSQPRGLVRTVRNEIQRLSGQSHRKLRFENGSCISAEDVAW